MSVTNVPPGPVLYRITTPGNDYRDGCDQVETHVGRLCNALDDAHEVIRRLTRERDTLRAHVDRLTEELYVARQGPGGGGPSPADKPLAQGPGARNVVVIDARTEAVTPL